MDTKKLAPEDWLRAARRAMLRGGPAAVSVEGLARALKVTKGSFYWHFRDRAELLEAVLREWELETTELFARATAHAGVRAGLEWLFAEVGGRVVASERGEAPSDAAIFAWSAADQRVARRVAKVEHKRLQFLGLAAGSEERGELAYLCYLGFLDRRRRVPGMSARFTSTMRAMLEIVLPSRDASARKVS